VHGLSSCPTWSQRFPVGTCNVLMKRSLLSGMNTGVDESIGLEGWDDMDLFARLVRDGAKSVWDDTATAYEHLPLSRCTSAWVVQRWFRTGLTYARTTC